MTSFISKRGKTSLMNWGTGVAKVRVIEQHRAIKTIKRDDSIFYVVMYTGNDKCVMFTIFTML